jgi:hypothetical protein
MFSTFICIRHANQHYTEIPSHPHQNGYHKENIQQQILGRMQTKKKPYMLLVGVFISAVPMEISMEVPNFTKNRTTM